MEQRHHLFCSLTPKKCQFLSLNIKKWKIVRTKYHKALKRIVRAQFYSTSGQCAVESWELVSPDAGIQHITPMMDILQRSGSGNIWAVSMTMHHCCTLLVPLLDCCYILLQPPPGYSLDGRVGSTEQMFPGTEANYVWDSPILNCVEHGVPEAPNGYCGMQHLPGSHLWSLWHGLRRWYEIIRKRHFDPPP